MGAMLPLIVSLFLFLQLVWNGLGNDSRCELTYINNQAFFVPAGSCSEVANFKSMTNSLQEIVQVLTPKGSLVVDVMSGYGLSYAVLADAVGKTGTIVAMERSATLFQWLQQNAVKNEAWTRTLLVHGDASDVVNSKSSQPLDVVVNQLGLGCPQLLRLNDNAETDAFNILISLMGTQAVMERCQPVLIIDVGSGGAQAATAIVDLLLQMRPGGDAYALLWGDAEVALHAQSHGGEVGGEVIERKELLVAIPRRVDVAGPLLASGALVPFTTGIDGTFDPAALTLWEQVEERLGGPVANSTLLPLPRTALRARVPLAVHLVDIVALNSSLRAALSAAGEAARSLGELRFDYDFSATFMVDNFGVIAASRCAVWRHRLASALAGDGDLDMDLRALQRACVDFISKRFRTTHRILYLRALQVDIDEQSRAGDTSTDVAGIPQLSEPAPTHTYYSLESEATTGAAERTMTQWFARAPFAAEHDEAICGEPIWCSHTQEIQRRIRAWQFPEEPSAPLPQHSTLDPLGEQARNAEAELFRTTHLDWSHRDGTATCASAKFLVYEPPSNGHGIGSMLELIAATFRYAICLDRILILSPYSQPATLLKWRHPGCQGNFVDCAFEPISSCVLTEQEIASAPVSKEGYGFETFPLREERILVLKGMPMVGEWCTLCYSEWRVDNKFFDGLFTGHTAFDRSPALLHMATFRDASKQTWASQFLRFLLRPRPWLSETISQLVLYSMRSPAEPTQAEAPSIAPQLLPQQRFPRRFLSLHVRFGMKVVEAVLQPLSRYMEFISKKLPEVTDIFVSTETEDVIHTLISEYPEYRFHYLRYPRREYLDLALAYQDNPYNRETDYVDELLFSLANLYVAAEAHAFVGTLSSNWCMMIMHLERTRGDGGYDYYSVDKGSAFTGCY